MLVIGLTGSIGMGKSTAAARFRERGIAVFDADTEVHRVYAGAAVPLVERAFPGTTSGGRVDRGRLSAHLVSHPEDFSTLEAIVHPLIQASERAFLQDQHQRGAAMAVLEIPLLLEAGGEVFVDAVVVVSASAEQQRKRVLARPGMTPEKLEGILARQLSDAEKRARADFVVDTGGTLEATRASIDAIIDSLQGRDGHAYARHWARTGDGATGAGAGGSC